MGMAKTAETEIVRLETTGEIARGWKAIAGGLAIVNKVIDDLLDPDQSDLFPLDPSDFAEEISQVLDETARRVKATKLKVPAAE